MAKTAEKNKWALFLLILSGIVLGGFIGYLTRDVSYLSWLNYGQEFGFDQPVSLNLSILTLTLGFRIKITVAGILGIIVSIILYRKL